MNKLRRTNRLRNKEIVTRVLVLKHYHNMYTKSGERNLFLKIFLSPSRHFAYKAAHPKNKKKIKP